MKDKKKTAMGLVLDLECAVVGDVVEVLVQEVRSTLVRLGQWVARAMTAASVMLEQ